MPDLLLELFSEEIPARMQQQAADDLRRLVTDAVVARGLTYEGAAAFATPRRLALHVAGLPTQQPDTREERKGPRVGAPDAAVQGFLKSAGLASLDQARVETDPKKGSFYVAVLEKAGRETLDVLAEALPAIIRSFPWPKSMRWGAASAQPDALRWVRPLHSIVATFGPETEDPQVVPFTIEGVAVGATTYGHRFMAPAPIKVRRFDDYQPALDAAKVVLDPARRRDIILHDARDLALAQGLELVEDDALLHEVAGLVEWPVVLLGTFDEAFLAIPPEVIRATIRANQKCFVLRKPDGGLANAFVITSNLVARDGGQTIAAGNARVVRARLSDAKFFWDTDRKTKLEERLPRLDSIVFHEKLGTQGERVRRIEALAVEIAKVIGADEAQTRRAAQLAKADLVSEMVGEFPELQGLMGRYYSAEQGEPAAVAAAIEEHYKPQGPSDRVPSAPVSMAVALADKLDTLVGFWAIDEKPTGSKDPYALRRAALGVIRIIIERNVRAKILALTLVGRLELLSSLSREGRIFARYENEEETFETVSWPKGEIEIWQSKFDLFNAANPLGNVTGEFVREQFQTAPTAFPTQEQLSLSLLAFFADRLKIYLRDKGARHDLIDAVFALPGQDDLLMIVRRVEALGAFLDTEDGKNLLAGYRRAANIVRIEDKKTPGAADGAFDDRRIALPEERALADTLGAIATQVGERVTNEDFAGAMQALSTLRVPVDAFFDKVTVNDADPALRANRLKLLTALRDAMHQVADFSRIVG